MNKKLKLTLNIIIYIFAGIGLFLVLGYFAVRFGLTNTKGIIDIQRTAFYNNTNSSNIATQIEWSKTEEWGIFAEAVKKDRDVLIRVENETGVPARLIISVLAVEQLRLFTSEREIFKRAFSPLKILGTQSQFSWGVMGIKPETAEKIEANLKDKTSQFYLGEAYENKLDFKTDDIGSERFTRITDEHDRYYAYLYGSLYIKQFIEAWKKSGHEDISSRPEIIGTLYNIGFNNFEPKENPQVGGSEIEIDGIKYSFGGLTYEIYNSRELLDYFPR